MRRVCNNVEEAEKFINLFGHLTSQGRKRIKAFYNGDLKINYKGFAWMNPKHIPELKNYPEQSVRMWINPVKEKN